MWVLINNIPVNVMDISGVSRIKERNDKFYFFYKIEGELKISKKYESIEKAERKRNSLLLFINMTFASLPKIEI